MSALPLLGKAAIVAIGVAQFAVLILVLGWPDVVAAVVPL